MTEQEIKDIISAGEDFHLEFKEEIENNDDFAKVIVSFANSEGGKIVAGISDNKTISGVKNNDKFMLKIDDIAFNLCKPPVTIMQETTKIDNKDLVIINVPKGIQRPYQTKGKFYVRSSNNVREASREELLRIFQTSQSIFYDELPIHSSTLSDINISAFRDFLQNYYELDSRKITDDEFAYYLKNLHLSENGIPTVSGILFFGKKPQHFIKEARIVVAFIEGDDIAIPPSDKKELIGDIADIIEDAERFFKIYLKEKHVIKDFEPETNYELPLSALREAVINAIAHRDYTIASPIRIIIFSNRIEVHSPGKLPNTVTVESIKIGGSHVLRNPTIYNLLVKMRMVTDLGSGVRRIIKLVKDYTDKEVDFKVSDGEFVIIIHRPDKF